MHSFDPKIAEKVGINAAILYQNIVWWCEKNLANKANEHDGRNWTYNSVKAWSTLFPYMTQKQIRTALDRLESEGLVVSGIYNKMAKDRTKWYSSQVDPICPVGQSHLPLRADAFAPEGKPLPDSKPDIKPVVIYPLPPRGNDAGFDDFYEAFPRKKDPQKARAAYARAVKKVSPDVLLSAAKRYAQERAGQDPRYTKHPTSWLNAGSWENQPDETQQDFHKMISQALETPNALSGPSKTDHGATQRLPAPLQEAGPSGQRNGTDRIEGSGRGGQSAYSDLIQPRRFGGTGK